MKRTSLVTSIISLGTLATLSTSVLVVSSCGKGVLGGTTAQLSFNDSSVTASTFDLLKHFRLFSDSWAAAAATPAYYGVRFLSAYLAEDVDGSQNNVGQVAKIYLNPGCPENTGCTSNDQVTTYFDFARSSAEVNAELNGQKRIIKPGSYKYVRLDFCISGGIQNVAFRETAAGPLVYGNSNNCGKTSQAMSPALSIEEGDQVIINLNYSLTNLVVDYPGAGNDVVPTSGSRGVGFPAFVPTVKKL